MVILALLTAFTAGLRAQHVESAQTVSVVAVSPVERALQTEIVCMCGTCGRKRIGECTCSKAAEMREELAGLVAKGLTHDQIIDYYVGKWGSQEVLASPIDKGFNRLAWFVPYLAGASGIVLVGFAAIRWSRRRQTAVVETSGPAIDPDMDERLNDELRNLD